MNQQVDTVAGATSTGSESRSPTPAEWAGITLVALLFTWASLGIFVWHYYLIEASASYTAHMAEGGTVFDSIPNYGIPKAVALAAAVLLVLRNRWAAFAGCAWITWVLLGQLVGLLRFGLEGLVMFSAEIPVMSGLVILLFDSILIAAANYLITLRRRGVLR